MIRRLTILVVVFVFLGTMFGGFLHITSAMDVSRDMSGCAFMAHEEVVCSMSMLDHISAWESTFTSIATSFTLLHLALVAIVLAVAPNFLLRQKCQHQTLSREIRDRIYTFSYRPLQELFSNGILHPKIF